MRLAILLSLVSSLQIFQQSAVDSGEFRSIFEYSLVTAAFPIGKFIATCILSFRHVQLHSELDRCAKLLVFGAIVSAVPILKFWFSSFGRFIMGYSVGCGFICAPAVLRLAVPESMRPTNFLYLSAAFSFGTFLANSMFLVSEYVASNVVSALLAGLSGLLYLVLRPVEYPVEEVTETFSISAVSDDEQEAENTKSKHPNLFVFLLMVMNVSIGVPLIQTYSTLIFTYYGMNSTKAKVCSMVYPILQFLPVLISTRINVSRKFLVLGGYYIAVTTQFFLLLTSMYDYIPEKHQMIAMSVFVMFLSVAFAIPCNTGLCIVFEQFDGGNVKTASKSRCVMWFLSSVSTLTFAKFLEMYGFATTFAPYFITSLVSYIVILFIFPSKQPFTVDF